MALDFGHLDQLRAKYSDVNEAVSFIYDPETRPDIILKAKNKSSPSLSE